MSEYAHQESLVGAQWVADHLEDASVRIVEVVWGVSPVFGMPVYDGGHIPGALAWDFDKDLHDPARRDILDRAGMEALLSRSGIAPEMTIVLHSSLGNTLATFAFWQLKIHGRQHVRLLDGGRQIWLEEGRPLTNEAPQIAPTSYQSEEPQWDLRANRDYVLRIIGKEGHLLVDARSAEMFSGLDKTGTARGGHIPGAVNLAAFRETNADGTFKAWRLPTVEPDGTFKLAEELRAMCHGLGITPDKEIVTYCGRGGLSTHAWFVLTQLLDFSGVREYDRSWAEWGNDETLPIEQ